MTERQSGRGGKRPPRAERKVVPLPKRRAGGEAVAASEPKEADGAAFIARAERALAEMAAEIVSPAGVPEAHRAQLAHLCNLLEPRAAFLLEHAPAKELLHVAAVRGRNDPRIRAYAPGEGAPGAAFRDRKVMADGAMFAAPILGKEGAYGCVVLLSPKEPPSPALLLALAQQLGAAWEFGRVRDEAARRNKDLQTAVAGLRSLEKNREELLSSISHELKTPLTSIKAYLTMLSQGRLGELAEKQLKAVQTCERNSDRLLQMINDLLLLSRLQSGKMQLDERPFGLKDVVEDITQRIRPLADQSQVRLKLAPSPQVYVRGDRDRIGEAVYHLIDNAIHATPADSEVEIGVSDSEELATVTVRDRGPGIPEEDLPHLFDPYFRAKGGDPGRQLRGLGLPIVAKIVHLHGGRVDVANRGAQGSIFQLSLPKFAGAVLPVPEAAEPRAGGILLVEDDTDVREVLQQVLEDEGYRVMSASTAADAKAVLAHIRPALVLLDLRLADEDGRNVLHFIRDSEALKEVRVYIISGASDAPSLVGMKGRDRIDGFFEKPFQVPRLLDTVAAVARPTRRDVMS